MSERNRRDFLGLPWDRDSYHVNPEALKEFLGVTAGKLYESAGSVIDFGTEQTKENLEKAKKAGGTILGMGKSAVGSVIGQAQVMTKGAIDKIIGKDPSLGDRSEVEYLNNK